MGKIGLQTRLLSIEQTFKLLLISSYIISHLKMIEIWQYFSKTFLPSTYGWLEPKISVKLWNFLKFRENNYLPNRNDLLSKRVKSILFLVSCTQRVEARNTQKCFRESRLCGRDKRHSFANQMALAHLLACEFQRHKSII